MLVPKLRFKEFNNQWNTYKLEELVIFLDGQRKPIKDSDRNKFRGVYPYYGASGIIDYVKDYIFDKDTILLSEDGANILTRSTRLAFIASGKYWVNNHAHVLEPKNTNIYFLCELLESLNYEQYNTGTAQPKLNQEICKNIELTVPDIMEQSKIGNFLSLLDKKIELQKKKIETLKIYKTGLFNKIYKEKLNDIKESELREYAYLQGGYAFKSELFSKKGTPIIRIANINENIVDLKDVVFYDKEIPIDFKFEINTGDILIAMSGATTGKMGIYKEKIKSYLNQRVGKIVLKRKDMIYSYLYFLFELSSYNMQLNTKLVAGAQPNISPTDIENLKFKIPSIKLQEHIANIVMNINKKLEIEGNKLQELNELKKGLLQKMFI